MAQWDWLIKPQTPYTWRFVRNVVIKGLALFVVVLPLLLVGVVVAVGVSAVLGIVLILITLLGQIAVAGAMTGVLSAALYRFGTTGLVAPGFSEADMWAAFDRR